MNILIVDDSLTIRSFLKMELKTNFQGCKIIEACDGKDAMHALTENSFDLIITDLEMGENDGDVFIKKLLGNKILKKKKIIVYSSKKDFLVNFDIPLSENLTFIDKSETRDSLIKKIDEFYKKSL